MDCSRATHEVGQRPDGKWFEYFVFNGQVYENEITGPTAATKTPASKVIENWGLCSSSNSNIIPTSTVETSQPSNQLEANLTTLRANYEAKQSNASGMGGDGIGWILLLGAGMWAIKHSTRLVDDRVSKQVTADLQTEYQRIRTSTPLPALAGAQTQRAETHEVTRGDNPSVTASDRVTVTDSVTASDREEDEVSAGPVYCVNGWTLAQFKQEHCPEGGGLRVDKLHDSEYADIAASKVFYFLKTYGFAPLEFCVWYVFGLGKKGGDSPSAQRYQVAANFCDRIFDKWRLPY